MNEKVQGLNESVEERLIGCEEPTEEDVEDIEEYEAAKKHANKNGLFLFSESKLNSIRRNK